MTDSEVFSSDLGASLQSLISDSFHHSYILSVRCPLLLPRLVSLVLSFSYRRTSETLSQASLKATAAFSNVGSAISKKLEDVRSVRQEISAIVYTVTSKYSTAYLSYLNIYFLQNAQRSQNGH